MLNRRVLGRYRIQDAARIRDVNGVPSYSSSSSAVQRTPEWSRRSSSQAESEVAYGLPRARTFGDHFPTEFCFLVDEPSNMPMKRTKACQLSVEVQQAGAARLFRNTAGPRAAPAVLLSTIT